MTIFITLSIQQLMTIIEHAIIVLKSPPDFSDPTLHPLFEKLSAWQSECSGFPLHFFTSLADPHQVHLVTGWPSVGAHEVWIRGERNQELLRVFGPYVDMDKVRMVHLDIDFEVVPGDVSEMVIERYTGEAADLKNIAVRGGSEEPAWVLFGRDLAQDCEDIYRFVGGDVKGEGGLDPVEWWVLKRVEP